MELIQRVIKTQRSDKDGLSSLLSYGDNVPEFYFSFDKRSATSIFSILRIVLVVLTIVLMNMMLLNTK